VHRYLPKGLIPSAPASVTARPFPSVEFWLGPPFAVEVVPFDLFAVEFFLPGPESGAGWNALEHAWHVGLEFAVSSTVITDR